MRDVNAGWALRYTHANVASFFFIFVYAQIISFLNCYLKIKRVSPFNQIISLINYSRFGA